MALNITRPSNRRDRHGFIGLVTLSRTIFGLVGDDLSYNTVDHFPPVESCFAALSGEAFPDVAPGIPRFPMFEKSVFGIHWKRLSNSSVDESVIFTIDHGLSDGEYKWGRTICVASDDL